IPWLAAKTILDPMEMALPDLSDCLEETGDANPMKALQHLAKSPQDFTIMTNLRTNASQAREAVFKFLEGWMVLA
ncbi:MAG: hypothetical protein Q7S68_02810, partial [Deltaproteobacteria bacterium]|nr:hypothetical protein [Deltaproteobacteria bacterium]